MKMKMSRFFEFLTIVSMLCACSDVGKTAGTDEQSEGVFAVKDREIAGVTQKGPFLTGSAVTIQELDSLSLEQNGKSFRTSVKSDRGDFVIKHVNLVSRYAMLEVCGFYSNENTGEASDGMLVLNAVTDLADRSHVNVNVLTHLEYQRVLNLVQKQGMSFAEAKKQAESEIFSSFGFSKGIKSPEDFDIFMYDECDYSAESECYEIDRDGGALLAISVLMQGDRSVAEFSELLAHASFSFADSGFWHGTEKAKMADWAVLTSLDEHGALYNAEIYVGSVNRFVPNFKEYIYRFWVNEYGLGSCDSENYGDVRANANILSELYGEKFICDSSYRKWVLVGQRKWDGFSVNEVNPQTGMSYWRPKNLDFEFSNSGQVDDDGDQYCLLNGIKYPRGHFFCPDVAFGKNSCYGDDPKNCKIYGMMYDYESASMACSKNFRLPKYDEAEELLQRYGGAGKNAVDSMLSINSFAALLGGHGKYEGLHKNTAFWISSEGDSSGTRYVLWVDSSTAEIRPYSSELAYVRCVLNFDNPDVQWSIQYAKDSRDGQFYRYGSIIERQSPLGKSDWIEERIRYKGDSINNPCVLNDGNCLYSWKDAIGLDSVQGMCPIGWRMSTFGDWYNLLKNNLGAQDYQSDSDGAPYTVFQLLDNYVYGAYGSYRPIGVNSLKTLFYNEGKYASYWVNNGESSVGYLVEISGVEGFDKKFFKARFRIADKQELHSVLCVR